MKKLWILSLAMALAMIVGCAPEDAPPVANPTGEKAADDKAAAGPSGVSADADGAPKSEPETKGELATKGDGTPEFKGSGSTSTANPGQPLPKSADPAKGPEKSADDTKVYVPDKDAGKGLPPPGTPMKSGS